jgi:hypothetical protein
MTRQENVLVLNVKYLKQNLISLRQSLVGQQFLERCRMNPLNFVCIFFVEILDLLSNHVENSLAIRVIISGTKKVHHRTLNPDGIVNQIRRENRCCGMNRLMRLN